MKLNFLILILSFFVFSCSLFQPRTPEEPELTNQNFPPAVSPQILIDNFTKSFNQKNIVAYSECFSEEPMFRFTASPDVSNIYPGIFDNWNLGEEKLFAYNLFSKFLNETSPNLSFSNILFSTFNPDSTFFIADYYCEINSTDKTINQTYKGKLHFTLVQNKKAIWTISRWVDLKSGSSESPSISTLKAILKYD